MLKSLILGSAIAALAVINIGVGKLKPAAAANYAMSRSCLDAVNQAQSKIRGAGVESVVVNVGEMSEESGYPDGKPFSVRYALDGSADVYRRGTIKSVMRSSKMLLSLSSNIIKNCDGVSWVGFGVNQSDDTREFLLMDGDVRPLTCLDSPVRGATMPWGFSYCP